MDLADVEDKILCISIYLESGGIHKVPFGKRATVYSGVANLREIFHAEVTAKPAENVDPEHGSNGSKTITGEEPESGNLGTGNGEMLVTGEFNNQLWFSVNCCRSLCFGIYSRRYTSHWATLFR